MASAIEVVDDIGSRQWSLVARRQLLEAGVSAAQIELLRRRGVIRPVRPHIYAMVGSARSWEQQLLAAVLGAGRGAVASHSAAAALWEFAHRPADRFDVTVAVDPLTRTRSGRRGLHRTVILPADDVSVRSAIPCTSFERTLCDCTTLLSAYQLSRVLDDGLRRGVTSLERLERCVVRLDSGPGRRLRTVKNLLAERDEAFHPGGSASELHVLEVLREAGLPLPVQQHRVSVNGRSFDLDFAWPESRVFAEYYGLHWHSGASAVAYDSARLTALVADGWRPLVFTSSTPEHEIVRSTAKLLSAHPSDDGLTDRMSA